VNGNFVALLGFAVAGNAIGLVDLEFGGIGKEREGEEGW
jgi:hypothetical protein